MPDDKKTQPSGWVFFYVLVLVTTRGPWPDDQRGVPGYSQSMRSIVFLLFVVVAGSADAQAKGPALPNQGLEIVQRFGGSAKMVVSDNLESKEPPPLLITDQTTFEKFVTLLPLTEMSKTSVPGPNSDPLVKAPRFDWSRYMLLVVFDSQSLSFPPNVSRVEIQGSRLVAVVEYPDTKNLIEAKPPEIGSYGAALVIRSERPLEWANPGHRAQEAQRQSMMMFLPKSEQ